MVFQSLVVHATSDFASISKFGNPDRPRIRRDMLKASSFRSKKISTSPLEEVRGIFSLDAGLFCHESYVELCIRLSQISKRLSFTTSTISSNLLKRALEGKPRVSLDKIRLQD
jgi:hypothetical protein